MGPILRRARSLMALPANRHRILVLGEGRVTAIYDAAGATQERIMASATLAEEDGDEQTDGRQDFGRRRRRGDVPEQEPVEHQAEGR